GTAGIVSVTLCAGASLGCPGEKRPPHRPVAVDRRAPPARDRRGGAGDPLPPVARMHDCRASVSGRAHGDRPDRAAGRPGDLRGSEDSAGQRLREPARGGDGGEAARAGEGGAGLGGPLREAGGHLSVRLHRDRGQQAGAPGRRVPPRVAITGASVYIRASSNEAPNPCRGHSWPRTRKSGSSRTSAEKLSTSLSSRSGRPAARAL